MIDSVIRGSLAALLFCAPSSTAIADQSDPRLPQLFTTLETSSHQPEAQEAAVRIWHIWTQSGDDDVELPFASSPVAKAARYPAELKISAPGHG